MRAGSLAPVGPTAPVGPVARTTRAAFVVGLALGLSLIAGCTSSGSIFGNRARNQAASGPGAGDAAGQAETSASGSLEVYLEMMQSLVEGDALTRAETFNAARDAADYAPTTTNRLRYALALSIPGHSGSDATAAAGRLRDLLAAPDALLPEERMLATIQLEQAEQLALLEDNSAELAAKLAAADEKRDAETANQIKTLQAQNAKLQADLEDANQMLNAITQIEQSLSERENDGN